MLRFSCLANTVLMEVRAPNFRCPRIKRPIRCGTHSVRSSGARSPVVEADSSMKVSESFELALQPSFRPCSMTFECSSFHRFPWPMLLICACKVVKASARFGGHCFQSLEYEPSTSVRIMATSSSAAYSQHRIGISFHAHSCPTCQCCTTGSSSCTADECSD